MEEEELPEAQQDFHKLRLKFAFFNFCFVNCDAVFYWARAEFFSPLFDNLSLEVYYINAIPPVMKAL